MQRRLPRRRRTLQDLRRTRRRLRPRRRRGLPRPQVARQSTRRRRRDSRGHPRHGRQPGRRDSGHRPAQPRRAVRAHPLGLLVARYRPGLHRLRRSPRHRHPRWRPRRVGRHRPLLRRRPHAAPASRQREGQLRPPRSRRRRRGPAQSHALTAVRRGGPAGELLRAEPRHRLRTPQRSCTRPRRKTPRPGSRRGQLVRLRRHQRPRDSRGPARAPKSAGRHDRPRLASPGQRTLRRGPREHRRTPR